MNGIGVKGLKKEIKRMKDNKTVDKRIWKIYYVVKEVSDKGIGRGVEL